MGQVSDLRQVIVKPSHKPKTLRTLWWLHLWQKHIYFLILQLW